MADAKRICTFPGCDRPLNARRLCSGHYRLLRRGETLRPLAVIARERDSLDVRLARHTTQTESCWLWSGTVQSQGYGTLAFHGRKLYAHRLAYENAYGPIPDGLVIDHMCRNRLCVRPDHLQVVTQQANNENLSLRANSISGSRGVTWSATLRKWRGTVGHDYRSMHVGYFDTIAEAEAMVRRVRMQLHTNNLDDRAGSLV